MSIANNKSRNGKGVGKYDKLSMTGTGKKSTGTTRNVGTSHNVGTSRNKGTSRNVGTSRNNKK